MQFERYQEIRTPMRMADKSKYRLSDYGIVSVHTLPLSIAAFSGHRPDGLYDVFPDTFDLVCSVESNRCCTMRVCK